MYKEIIKFWFEEISQTQWWKKDVQFDQLIASQFQKSMGRRLAVNSISGATQRKVAWLRS